VAGTYGPPRRKNNVGAPPPEKWWQRHARHRYQIRLPVADIVDDWRAIALHYVATAPVRAPRWLHRHRDHDLAPIVAGVCAFLVLVALSAISPVHLLPRSLELIACSLAGAGIAWSYIEPDHRAATERTVRAMQKTLTAKINGLTVQAVQERAHATKVICSVAPGLDPDDYEHQKSTLSSSFRMPLTITKDTPGRLELRLEHDDLLAKPAEWHALEGLDPRRIPAGHDWDGDPFSFPLAHQSLLVAGIRGGGKSAFLNGLIARLAAMPHVELYLIDPLEGVDLGVWWRVAQEVADSEERGVKLLGHFEDLRAERVRRMVSGDRPVQIARHGARWPMRCLVVDELASLALWGSTAQQRDTANLLHSIAAKGRKSNDVIIAATQHPSTAVLPQLVRGQFTNILGLRVGRREQTRQVFGDGMVGQWDLSQISADHPGRGIWSNGSGMTPVRTAGLWGPRLQEVAGRLAEDLPMATRNGSNSDPEMEIDVSPLEVADVADRTADRIRAALPTDRDISVRQLADLTGLSERTIRYHLEPGRHRWVVKVGRGRYRRAS
jgi:FtsK/SpoIIIE family